MCTNGTWDCGDEKCAEQVNCPNNMVYLENMRRCGRSCQTYMKKAMCPADEPITEGCGCPDDLVLGAEVSYRTIPHGPNAGTFSIRDVIYYISS